MRYNINASLIYNAADGTLTLPGSDAPDTQLSLTTNALFLFLLENPHIISREEILKKIWDDNGLTSSSSNLNQYLSMLRKTFRYYGINNIILTVSRGNLQLNPEISVDTIEKTPEQTLSQPRESEVLPQKQCIPLSSPALPHFISWYRSGLILLGLSFIFMIMTLVTDRKLKPVTLTPLTSGQCHLLASKEMLSSIQEKTYTINFNTVRQALKIDCLPSQNFTFFYGDRLQTNGLGRVYLAHCTRNDDNPFSYCDSYFYYSWKP